MMSPSLAVLPAPPGSAALRIAAPGVPVNPPAAAPAQSPLQVATAAHHNT